MSWGYNSGFPFTYKSKGREYTLYSKDIKTPGGETKKLYFFYSDKIPPIIAQPTEKPPGFEIKVMITTGAPSLYSESAQEVNYLEQTSEDIIRLHEYYNECPDNKHKLSPFILIVGPESEKIIQIYPDYEGVKSILAEIDKKEIKSLVKKFLEKYQKVDAIPSDDVKKFQELLKIKYDIDVTISTLIEIFHQIKKDMNTEALTEKYKTFEKIISKSKSSSIEEYVNLFLEFSGENWENDIWLLQKSLSEANLMANVEQDIYDLVKKMELDIFERRLLNGTAKPDLESMSGYEFEMFLEELFIKMGYKAHQTSLSGDQGADLVIEKFGEKTAVQAKCHTNVVGNTAIQEIVASCKYYHCTKSMVVTTSSFTRQAEKLAESNDVELIDGKKLNELIEEHW